MGKYKEAILDQDRAIQINPQYGAAYMQRGLSQGNLNNFEGAIADLNQAINLISETDVIAQALWTGLSPEDIQVLKESKQRQISHANFAYSQAYNTRGFIRLALREPDYESALVDYNKAIELYPNPGYYENRGDYYTKVNQPEKAKADYETALQLLNQQIEAQANNASLYRERADIREELKDYPGALADYSKSIDLQPNEALTYTQRGDVRKESGDYEGAIQDYTTAIQLYPESNKWFAYWERAKTYDESKESQKAIDDYTKVIELAPSNADKVR